MMNVKSLKYNMGKETIEEDIERRIVIIKEMKMKIDYKVKDLSLAEFGRQEILLAQDEMPALMQLKGKLSK